VAVIAGTVLSLAMSVVLTVPASSATRPRYMSVNYFPKFTTTSNLLYGRAPVNGVQKSLYLDLWQPYGDTASKRPVIVFAHGGAWHGGDKADGQLLPLFQNLARRGFVVASVNFRLDDVNADATHDMQAAVRWLRAKAATYRIDTNRIVAMGSSSGGIQALQVAYQSDDPGTSGNPGYPSNVAGAVSISFGVHDKIDAGEPPIAIIQALDDQAHPFPLSEATCLETQAKGNVCELFRYRTGGHGVQMMSTQTGGIAQRTSEFLCRHVLANCVTDPYDPTAIYA